MAQRWRRRAAPATSPMATALAAVAAVAVACGGGDDGAAPGERVYRTRGCQVCHTVDGAPSVGPTWKGIYGRLVTLQDGRTVTVDDAYLERSIRRPQADRVAGFTATMPTVDLSDEEVAAVIDYIRSLG